MDVKDKADASVVLRRYGNPYHMSPLSIRTIDWVSKLRWNQIHYPHISMWEKCREQMRPEVEKRGIDVCVGFYDAAVFWVPRDKYQKDHPDWFKSNPGPRKWNKYPGICFSEPDAIKELVKNVVEYAKKRPEVKMIGLEGPDPHWCPCEKCKDARMVLVFSAARIAAKAIREVRDDVFVDTQGAGRRQMGKNPNPPKIDGPLDNIRIFGHAEWPDQANQVCAFIPTCGDFRGIWKPRPFHEHVMAWHKKQREHGKHGNTILGRMINPERGWWSSSYGIYSKGKILWDQTRKPDDILNDYCEKYYGPLAAKHMRDFIINMAQQRGQYASARPKPGSKLEDFQWTKSKAPLMEALKLVQDGKIRDEKIIGRINKAKMHLEYLNLMQELEYCNNKQKKNEDQENMRKKVKEVYEKLSAMDKEDEEKDLGVVPRNITKYRGCLYKYGKEIRKWFPPDKSTEKGEKK